MSLKVALGTTAPGRRRRLSGGEAGALTAWVVLSLSMSALAGDGPVAPPASPESVVVGITAPYREATLAPVLPGRIARMVPGEGEVVGEGDLVFSLDDHVQRARTEMARAAAESTIDVELARARREHARRDLDRLSGLYGDDSASSKELSDALARADITRLEYDLAKFAHAQAVRAHEREQAALERFHTRAPFTGYVREHLHHVGETVDEKKGVTRLAQLNPLKVSIDCPLTLASSIQVGDRLWVQPVDPQWRPRRGTVVLSSRVADGASQTFKVKLSVDNEDSGWMAGVKVSVLFPAPGEAGTNTAARPQNPRPDPAGDGTETAREKRADTPRH